MARALTLGKMGMITVEMILSSKASSKPLMFAKTTNKASGKDSFKETAFSFARWGDKTWEYMAMINIDLRETTRQKIVKDAHAHYKSKQPCQSFNSAVMGIDHPEHPLRRCIRDLSDNED